jgi:uncharacterized protein YaaW (UPF0174 family)
MDSVVTKGLVVGMLTLSAGGMLGILGGSMLSRIGFQTLSKLNGLTAINILTKGAYGLTGIGALNLIGGIVAGTIVFIPSTIFFYAGTNFKKTIPVIIMLLARVHLNKSKKTLIKGEFYGRSSS